MDRVVLKKRRGDTELQREQRAEFMRRAADPNRPKRGPAKIPRLLKEAIIIAAERVGRDGQGKEGLIGYLMRQARNEPVAFLGLLGKVIPLQVQHSDSAPRMSLEEAAASGMTVQGLMQKYMDAAASLSSVSNMKVIEHRKEEVGQ